jgi:hypothetical protein
LIGVERPGLRRHPDNHQFSFRVDVNELPVDAERDQHAVIAVDAIPLVAVARLGNISAILNAPTPRDRALVDIVDRPSDRRQISGLG